MKDILKFFCGAAALVIMLFLYNIFIADERSAINVIFSLGNWIADLTMVILSSLFGIIVLITVFVEKYLFSDNLWPIFFGIIVFSLCVGNKWFRDHRVLFQFMKKHGYTRMVDIMREKGRYNDSELNHISKLSSLPNNTTAITIFGLLSCLSGIFFAIISITLSVMVDHAYMAGSIGDFALYLKNTFEDAFLLRLGKDETYFLTLSLTSCLYAIIPMTFEWMYKIYYHQDAVNEIRKEQKSNDK